MSHLLCFFSPVNCATTYIAKATLGDLFTALTTWILNSVQWFLTAAGQVLTSMSEPTTVVDSANQEFGVLLVLAPILMMIGLLVSTLHALRHGDASSLWRVYLGVAPACVAGIFLAKPLTVLILEGVNQMSSTAAASVANHTAGLVAAFNALSTTTPGFGLFILALAVVVGTWLLWCELLLRTVVLSLLLVLVPVIVPLSTFPSLRRLGWRLAETFLAVASSKFLIVIALTLGLDELQGSSASEIVEGAVTILLATCSPFILLRVIPFVEQSALHNLEGVRQRFTKTVTALPSSPAVAAARSLLPDAPLPEPPARPDDLGLGMWEAGPDVEFPSHDGPPPEPPIGTPRLRGGHVAYGTDEMGPVVGWHFDE
ncbi:MAG: hypothetical protein WAN30_02965 [Acidimicrobiales bacterium]